MAESPKDGRGVELVTPNEFVMRALVSQTHSVRLTNNE